MYITGNKMINFKDFFKNIKFFGFFENKDSIAETEAKIAALNTNRVVKENQIWRMPLEEVDKFLEPVFFTIKEVDDLNVSYSPKKHPDTLFVVKKEKFKKEHVFIKEV